jgi:EF hand
MAAAQVDSGEDQDAADRARDSPCWISTATEFWMQPKSTRRLYLLTRQERRRSDHLRGSPRVDASGPADAAAPQNSVVEDTVKTLMAFDANGDGKLSKSELPERFQGIFDRGDENKDGFLTPDEIRKVAAAQAAPSDAGPGGRGGREGGERNFIRIDPVLAAIDTNGDGILSAVEIRNAADAVRKLDRNGDGRITRDELTPAGQGRQF